MKTCIQTLGILALAASLSYAEEAAPKGGKGKGGPEAMFKKLDADGSGSISLEEFKASPRGQKAPDKAEAAFKKINADGSEDGISLEEFKAAPKGKGARGPKGPKGAPAPAPAPAPEGE